MNIYISFIFLLLTFTTCKSKSFRNNITPTEKKELSAKQRAWTDSLPFLDSVIVLAQVRNSNYANKNLTEEQAMTCLYKYFKKKGISSRTKASKLNNNGRLCVDYDTLYRIQTGNFSGAVISFWLGPSDLNGHCFQPKKAIIRHTRNGYKFTDEDFVLTNFIVDSTVASTIFGYDYDCGGKGILRHFTIALR